MYAKRRFAHNCRHLAILSSLARIIHEKQCSGVHVVAEWVNQRICFQFDNLEDSLVEQRDVTPLLFENLLAKPIKLAFDAPHTSSDGGAVLMEAINQKMD